MFSLFRTLTLSLGLVFLCANTFAEQKPHPAEVLVQDTTEKVLGVIRQPTVRNDKTKYRQEVNHLLLSHFDFKRMARSVMGKNWRSLNPKQRDEFSKEFQELLVKNYSENLYRHVESTVDYLPIRIKSNGRVIVRTVVTDINNRNLSIDYSMYNTNEMWKVYDVSFEGISLVINLRQGVASELKQHGADHLIKTLRQRNAKPSKS